MQALTFLAPLLASVASPAGPVVGTVAVTLADANPGNVNIDRPYTDAVGRALGEVNFTIMPGAEHSRYLAQVAVLREHRGVVTTKGTRGRTGALVGPSGPGVVVPFGSGGKQLRDLIATTLTVRLFSRSDRRLVWSGSAVTVRIDGAAMPGQLARAAVATFPQTLAAPVPVP